MEHESRRARRHTFEFPVQAGTFRLRLDTGSNNADLVASF